MCLFIRNTFSKRVLEKISYIFVFAQNKFRDYYSNQGRREGGRAGNFYQGPRLNGGPEELDYGARERQGIKEPYNFYRGPSILSTALIQIRLQKVINSQTSRRRIRIILTEFLSEGHGTKIARRFKFRNSVVLLSYFSRNPPNVSIKMWILRELMISWSLYFRVGVNCTLGLLGVAV